MKIKLIILALIVTLGLLANFETKSDNVTWSCTHVFTPTDKYGNPTGPTQQRFLGIASSTYQCRVEMIGNDEPYVKNVLKIAAHDCNASMSVQGGPFQ